MSEDRVEPTSLAKRLDEALRPAIKAEVRDALRAGYLRGAVAEEWATIQEPYIKKDLVEGHLAYHDQDITYCKENIVEHGQRLDGVSGSLRDHRTRLENLSVDHAGRILEVKRRLDATDVLGNSNEKRINELYKQLGSQYGALLRNIKDLEEWRDACSASFRRESVQQSTFIGRLKWLLFGRTYKDE